MYKTIKWTFWIPLVTCATVTTFPIMIIIALAGNDNWTDFWHEVTDFYGDMWKVGEKRE